ncbi:Papain cysteine protease family protein [Theileria equi strain WA]|uniref:Papain cysteine protease family protein n=1 Tax=Theileria equi strain WA TaxID=1537102 RepID=L1LFH8_THEEQ|nr:Papain cysteine protease family protein [Theileria equi strain WA]EKX74010.1 Papain cysteine protease family protein [Theileria equi strain WA]|eukprot:XP_004833462.1 Papain cysteine protease family protein [Theileria equi strain WA]
MSDRKDSVETVHDNNGDRVCTKKVILIGAVIAILLVIVITVPIVVSLNRSDPATIKLELIQRRIKMREEILRKQPKTQTEFYEQAQALKKIREEELKPIMDIADKLKEELKHVKTDFLDGDSDECIALTGSKSCMKGTEVKYITYSELFYIAELLEPIEDKVNPKFEVQVFIRFKQYCDKYGINWEDEGTFIKYFFLFRRDVIKMEKHNRDPSKKYKKGYHTRLAEDVIVTDEEMKKVDYDGLDLSKYGEFKHTPFFFETDEAKKDKKRQTIDWREGGYVSIIDNNKKTSFKTGFALVAVAMYNTFVTIRARKRWTFSAQQLLDCITEFDDNRADLGKALEYFKTKPICFETRYPFTGKKESCKHENCMGYKPVKNIVKIDAGKAEGHLKKHGPFLTLFNAPEDLRVNYTGGIYDKQVGTGDKSMAMVVGSGQDESGKKYWIAQPAWKTSSSWGEDGYFRISEDIAKGSKGIFENAYGLSNE